MAKWLDWVASHVPDGVCYFVLIWFAFWTALLLFGNRKQKPVPALATAYAIVSCYIIVESVPVCRDLGNTFRDTVLTVVTPSPSARFLQGVAWFAGCVCGVALLVNCTRAFHVLTALDEDYFASQEGLFATIQKKFGSIRKWGEITLRIGVAFCFIALEQKLEQRQTMTSLSLEGVGICAFILYFALLMWALVTLLKTEGRGRFGWQLALFGCGLFNALAIYSHAKFFSADPILLNAVSFVIAILSSILIALIVILECKEWSRRKVVFTSVWG